MSYYGFYSDDYREGQRDAERNDRPDYDRDAHFGGEKDDAYFEGFNEVKREEERREEERREEERYQEEQEQQRENERQQQLEYEYQLDESNRLQEEENNMQEQEIYYQCFVCKKDFYNESDMREVRDGNTGVLYCAECYNEIFASDEELERLQIGL